MGRQLRLGVTHGGKAFRVIGGAPVALAVDQGVAITEGLSHEYHGFVAGTITVWVEFTEHIPHGSRRFGIFGLMVQAKLTHCIDDASLHRLQPIGYVRQRAVVDYVHGVVQVRALGKLP